MEKQEIQTALLIMEIFVDASGLQINFQKSMATLIRCQGSDLGFALLLPCVVEFPCLYLGLPLSHEKHPKSQLQPYIDKVARRIPAWKGNLMADAGHLILVSCAGGIVSDAYLQYDGLSLAEVNECLPRKAL